MEKESLNRVIPFFATYPQKRTSYAQLLVDNYHIWGISQ